MPISRDLANDRRMIGGDFAEDEERRPRVVLAHQRQQPIHALLDAALEGTRIQGARPRAENRAVVVLLDINAERVRDHDLFLRPGG